MSNTVEIDVSVTNSWKQLTSESSTFAWSLFEYTDEQYSKLMLKSEGSLGIDEFVKHLAEDRVSWGIYRIITRNRYDDSNKKSHYILIQYIGSLCPNIKAYVANNHRASIKQHLPIAIEYQAHHRTDISINNIQKLLKEHHLVTDPTYFQFTFWNLDADHDYKKKPRDSEASSDHERISSDHDEDDLFPHTGYFP